MGLNVGNLPVKQVYVGSTPVKSVYVGSKLVWSATVQITLDTGWGARNQLLAALTARGLSYWKVTEIPFEIELVGSGSVQSMFDGCAALTTVPNMDTSNVTDMRSMFNDCTSLTSVPPMDTSNVTSMEGMFSGCAALVSVPDMDTSNVTSMAYMFANCSSLTTAPEMGTSKVTTMSSMFDGCAALTYVPEMDTRNVTDTNFMLYGCSSLTDGNVRLVGKHPQVVTWDMITASGLTREPWYNADGTPHIPIEVHEVSLTDVSGSGTVHPLLTVTVPAGETWSVRIQGTMTRAAAWLNNGPSFRVGTTDSGKYSQGSAVDFSGTVTAANSTIALVTNSGSSVNRASFTGTVTIEK